MADSHTVIPGEHVPRVAHRAGFRPYLPVWADPANGALRALRRTPHIVAPGDLVVLPDRLEREVERSTEQRHQFRLHARPLTLRMKLLRWDGSAVSGVPYHLAFGESATDDTTAGDGTLSRAVTPMDERGALVLEGRTIDVYVGHLEPIETLRGWRERLNNLGYDAGRSDDPNDLQLRSAVEEFQCNEGLSVDGIVGPNTRGRLRVVHGC